MVAKTHRVQPQNGGGNQAYGSPVGGRLKTHGPRRTWTVHQGLTAHTVLTATNPSRLKVPSIHRPGLRLSRKHTPPSYRLKTHGPCRTWTVQAYSSPVSILHLVIVSRLTAHAGHGPSLGLPLPAFVTSCTGRVRFNVDSPRQLNGHLTSRHWLTVLP